MRIPTRRAVISALDKAGVEEFASTLHGVGCEIALTDSTVETIRSAGVPAMEASEIASFPECLDGRVKTLHPVVHTGILADRRREEYVWQLTEFGVGGFDLVVVNLYPFFRTVVPGAEYEECIEKIDVSGPSMIRGVVKNHANVAIATDPSDYARVAEAARRGGFDADEWAALVARAFAHTAAYDVKIARWMAKIHGKAAAEEAAMGGADIGGEGLSGNVGEAEFSGVAAGGADRPRTTADKENELFDCVKVADLRYGENPHQSAVLYSTDEGGVARAVQLGGKEMSYNNYQGVEVAMQAAYDHAEPVVAMAKHVSPCGVTVAEDVVQAHSAAHACDPLPAYGGVITADREVDATMTEQVAPIFTEAITAPSFSVETLKILSSKKNLRTLRVELINVACDIRPISGGAPIQGRDRINAEGNDPARWRLASGESAGEATLRDLASAWRTVRVVKSNAILLADSHAMVGIRVGQVNRVDSCRFAVARVGERAMGSVAASDVLFPFTDGLEVLLDAGVRTVVQPGGSVCDQEVIGAARKAGVTIYLTGTHHFSH